MGLSYYVCGDLCMFFALMYLLYLYKNLKKSIVNSNSYRYYNKTRFILPN